MINDENVPRNVDDGELIQSKASIKGFEKLIQEVNRCSISMTQFFWLISCLSMKEGALAYRSPPIH